MTKDTNISRLEDLADLILCDMHDGLLLCSTRIYFIPLKSRKTAGLVSRLYGAIQELHYRSYGAKPQDSGIIIRGCTFDGDDEIGYIHYDAYGVSARIRIRPVTYY